MYIIRLTLILIILASSILGVTLGFFPDIESEVSQVAGVSTDH